MSGYLVVKTLHILSATLLFGTGLGTFFFMLMAVKSRNREAIKATAKTVVIADFIFTAPAVVFQLISGLVLMHYLNVPYTSTWFIWVIALFCFVGCLWLPVVWIQMQLSKIANAVDQGDLPPAFYCKAKLWERLGYPAGIAMLVIFYLMVFKPALYS